MWGPLLVLSEAGPIPVALVAAHRRGSRAPTRRLRVGLARRAARRAAARCASSARRRAAARRRSTGSGPTHGLAPLGCSVNACTRPAPALPGAERARARRRARRPARERALRRRLPLAPARAPGTQEWLDAIPADAPVGARDRGDVALPGPFLLQAAARAWPDRRWRRSSSPGAGASGRALGLGPPAPNVHVAEWLSHDDLLPRCSAVVTTGRHGHDHGRAASGRAARRRADRLGQARQRPARRRRGRRRPPVAAALHARAAARRRRARSWTTRATAATRAARPSCWPPPPGRRARPALIEGSRPPAHPLRPPPP